VQVPRYRRSSDERREQLKWLYSGATALICAFIGGLVGPSAAGEAFGSDGPLVSDVIELGATVFVICIGVAVLKYHLYAIDRIVSRVISYAGGRRDAGRRGAVQPAAPPGAARGGPPVQPGPV
jgi:hypothetical protein